MATNAKFGTLLHLVVRCGIRRDISAKQSFGNQICFISSGKDIDAQEVKLTNNSTSVSLSLGQHKLHAPFLKALKAYQAAEERSSQAAEKQMATEKMVRTSAWKHARP